MEQFKFNFKGYDYDLQDDELATIYYSLMDIESHLTRHFENEDFGKDTLNFVSVLISNNTQQYPITIREWSKMSENDRNNFCLGNEKVAKLLSSALEQSKNTVYATTDEVKDMLENYLYYSCYPYYSGTSKEAPNINKLPKSFVKENASIIKAATCNGILRNHMIKKQENLTKVTDAIENLSQSEK